MHHIIALLLRWAFRKMGPKTRKKGQVAVLLVCGAVVASLMRSLLLDAQTRTSPTDNPVWLLWLIAALSAAGIVGMIVEVLRSPADPEP